MHSLNTLFAAAALGLPLAAGAADAGYLDLYYVPSSTLEISDPSTGTIESDGGKGFGVKGMVPISPTAFLQGEYQANEYDGFEGVAVDTEYTQLRAGFRIAGASSPFYGALEFVRIELKVDTTSFDDSGFGLHAGVRSDPSAKFGAYAQIGYLDVGDLGDGIEFALGAELAFSPTVGMFADYRQSSLEDDSGGEGVVDDLRAGVRFRFGG